ncbi:MAG TPA: ATP-binding domain-containing protein [Acidimicrobiales bacterium]|nr:ATP-binding domain-containing protein [Acidimicrobiales bacterium]
MAHPDLDSEQEHLDEAYRRLEVLRADTQANLTEAFRERGGTFQSFTERDIRVRNSLNRLEQLEVGHESLIFGRIDRDGGDKFHIGRLALSDAEHEPLVVDWRAPVAEPFYRATGAYPMGLRRRRHFMTDGRRVLDLEDELFTAEGSDGSMRAQGLSGPGVLMAALARAHTGRMRDIVATVQAEQDEIIRAPLPGVLVVQGGPGTGKTAVALHRAAYLLYTHRFPLESQGVLVVGPGQTFLRYIDQVLPSLGETGVEMSTAVGLYRQARARAQEPAALARLKGGPRMAQLLRRAVRQRQRPLRRAVRIPYGRGMLTVTPEASVEMVNVARRRAGTHNSRRRALEGQLWSYLSTQLGERAATVAGAAGAPEAPSPTDLGRELRRRADISELLDRLWPRLSAEELLHDFLGAPALIQAAGRDLLSSEEIAMLFRERSGSLDEVPWTRADIALLDEAAALLGPLSKPGPQPNQPSFSRSGPRAAGEMVRTYGHIVVDEAQDLTPMELRMVSRRSLSGSMTLVGDIAQATGGWAPASWDEIVAHLPVHKSWRQVSLSVSYRAPAEVMRAAGAVLAEALPSATPPDPVRDTGEAPRVVAVPHPGDIGAAVAAVVVEEAAAVAGADGGADGSIGVLATPAMLDDVVAAIELAGLQAGVAGAGALDSTISVLALGDAKGLEFDAVIVVEPAAIAALPPHGLRALYVALTRCTRRLAIVHCEPLPASLERGLRS